MAENYITKIEEKGTINISEDVIVNIVRSAAIEVDGVAGFANTAGAEIAEFIGFKTMSKGVKIQLNGDKNVIDTLINVKYGSNIVSVAEKVQSRILEAVEAGTGIENVEVNVHVTGIAF